jgi:chromosome segregation ATPase
MPAGASCFPHGGAQGNAEVSVSESYPYQRSAAMPGGGDAESQHVSARLKQDLVQLAADQRLLKQQRSVLEQLKAELDARQRDLDIRQRDLEARQQETSARQRDLDARQRDLDARQRDADARRQDAEARQKDLEAKRQEVDVRLAQIHQQQETLTRRADELRAAEQELQARAGQLDSRQRELEELRKQWRAEADRLAVRQQDRTVEQQQLDVRQKALDARERELDARQRDLDARQRDADARLRGLDARQNDVDARHMQVRQREEALNRRAAEVQAAERALDQRNVSLEARQTDLNARAADLAELQKRLADRQIDLDRREVELDRRQQAFEQTAAAAREKAVAKEAARLAAAGEQIAALTRRLQGVQAEMEELRAQRDRAVARCDELARPCSPLRSHADQLTAPQKNPPAVAAAQPAALAAGAPSPAQAAAVHPGSPAAAAHAAAPDAASASSHSAATPPADELAALAAHAVRIRRRGGRAGGFPTQRRDRPGPAVAAGLAVLIGLLAGLGMWRGQAAKYRLQARIAFTPNSPLASGPELAKAQRELGGRLLDARLPGVLWPADRPPVLADARAAQLTVQVLTVSPAASQRSLRDVLAQYRNELEGSIEDAARAQQDRQLAERIAAAQALLRQLAADRQTLETEAARFEPQVKAYQEASAAAEKARKELEEAGRRTADVSARLRVLQRTPPGTRGEMSPERIAAAVASDVQLSEVRGQVIARAAVLQELLRGLLASALAKCDRMDHLLDGFGKFVAGQQEQISEQALRDETARVGERAARLKDVVQRCRRQIEDLSDVLSKSHDFAQAASLVAVQAKSEKALEVLTDEAAAAIQQVDDLLEKIPAGGVDVTRRTVLQQRLRSQFAEVQKAQQEMSETLNSLRPAVNFRLDAALTAVSGLARRYQDRYKALTEQIQQQDAQARRHEYDRQVQQAQAQREELAVECDRLLARLTEASGQMLDAEPGRSRSVQIRWQIDEVDRRIAATKADLEAARQKQANLQSTASQPAIAALDEPQIVYPPVNRAVRIGTAAAAGLIVSLLAFGAYVLSVRYLPRRQMPAPTAVHSARPSTAQGS